MVEGVIGLFKEIDVDRLHRGKGAARFFSWAVSALSICTYGVEKVKPTAKDG